MTGEELKRLKTARAIKKSKFTRNLNRTKDLVKAKKNYEFLENCYDEVNEYFKDIDELNDKILEIVPEGEFEEHENYMKELELEKSSLHEAIINLKEKEQKAIQCAVAVKKVDPPKFSGDIRDWPTWSKEYKRLVEARQGKDSFLLRSALDKSAQDLVKGLNDYDLMWERLEEVFADQSKLVACLMSDIRKCKAVTLHDHAGLIEFVNTVENVYLEINSMGQADELENSTVLCEVESLLPSNIAEAWSLKLPNVPRDKFKKLVDFLKEYRQAAQHQLGLKYSKEVRSMHVAATPATGPSKLEEVLTQVLTGQQEHQRQMMECMSGLTKMFSSMTASGRGGGTGGYRRGYRCPIHQENVHDLVNCPQLLSMNDVAKKEAVMKTGYCFICLKGIHRSRDCPSKIQCNAMVDGAGICGKYHHPILHYSFTAGSAPTPIRGAIHMVRQGSTLLGMSWTTAIGGHRIPTVYDTGSENSFILHDTARKFGLKGVPILLDLTKFGNSKDSQYSLLYQLTLKDLEGNEILVEVAGVDEITSEVEPIDVSQLAMLFEVDCSLIQRPTGRIEMLLGSDYMSLQPEKVKENGNMQLARNCFGYCVRGRLDTKRVMGQTMSVRTNMVQCAPSHIVVKPVEVINDQLINFFHAEETGIACQLKCGGCRCGKCTQDGEMSMKDNHELTMIKNGLRYDKERQVWVAHYPWIKDPNLLPNNYSQALVRLRSTERKLQAQGEESMRLYTEQINDMIQRGVARKLSIKEMGHYIGPVFYLTHHGVLKPESKSTPLRIVFNTALVFRQVALNDFMAKGPDCLNNLVGIMLRFKEGYIGVTGDIKKMYHSVHISEMDQHCHRFLWRNMESHRDPDVYVLSRVTFGDKAGGAIAMTALQLTAMEYQNTGLDKAEVERAVKIIQEDSYVDDILSSSDSYEEASKITGIIDKILKTGNFEIKDWIISGAHCTQVMGQPGEKALGLSWEPREDFFYFEIKLNFEGKHITSLEMLRTQLPRKLTKRILLSQVAKIFDVLGLLAPFIMIIKIAMRELVCSKLQWDEEIQGMEFNKWIEIFSQMFDVESLRFPRCIKPASFSSQPDLVIFADGSTVGFGAVAYVRWQVSEDTYCCYLIMAKGKLAPLRILTIPKVELCGAVIAVRLKRFILKEMRLEFGSTIFFIDSQIVHSQIRNDSLKHEVFVANRLSEIKTYSTAAEWLWIPSEHNAADQVSRGAPPSSLKSQSWMKGPVFLTRPQEEWPVKENTQTMAKTVDTVALACETTLLAKGGEEEFCIDISRYSSYTELINVTARIINCSKEKSLKSIGRNPTAEEVTRAVEYWIKLVQKSMLNDWEKKYQRLGPVLKDGILYVGSRITGWIQKNWNQDLFALLDSKHQFVKLYITHLHNLNHSGVESTLCKLQSKFWVPGARRIVKDVKKSCIFCRRLNKVLLGQTMGPLPPERTMMTPAFYFTALDLFGPIDVKDLVKKRTTMKVYGVLFTCMSTRAVYIDLTEGYDTPSFMKTLYRFVSIRGYPKCLYSDRGSQLVGAKNLLTTDSGLDKDTVGVFGQHEGTMWKFTSSADAPWQNGVTEALIRSVKRCIFVSIGDSIVSYSDLQTVFFKVADVLNSRPIGLKPGFDLDRGNYLCPNDLLLGRASSSAPAGSLDSSVSSHRRLTQIGKITDDFWKRMMRYYFHTLIVRQKWHVTQRNLQTGDIVLMKDSNSLKGEWRLGQVVKALPGKDGKVRDVTLRYKIVQHGKEIKRGQKFTYVDRSVHNLVLIMPIEEMK